MHRTIGLRCGFEMMGGDSEVSTEGDAVVVEVGWLVGPGTGFLLDFSCLMLNIVLFVCLLFGDLFWI